MAERRQAHEAAACVLRSRKEAGVMQETMAVSDCAAWLGFPEEDLRKGAEEFEFPITLDEEGREVVRKDDFERWLAIQVTRQLVKRVG